MTLEMFLLNRTFYGIKPPEIDNGRWHGMLVWQRTRIQQCDLDQSLEDNKIAI